MKMGIIGLGKMGINMARRLLRDGHEVVAYNRTFSKTEELSSEGAVAAETVKDLVGSLESPRIIWIMLPAGKAVDEHIDMLTPFLAKGDIIIEGGNSYYRDDIRRAAELDLKGVGYLDAGVSGGVWGLKVGYCIMIGGKRANFEQIEPLLKSLAPNDGYLYCGENGAGHFVKMVHNGIEYAMMEAYGEGFEILEKSKYGKNLNFSDISRVWNQGSVIRSWLLELLEDAFKKDPDLSSLKGYVDDSGEGRWTVIEAVNSGAAATSIAHALFKRFNSRDPNLFSNRILAALRNEFGGHAVKEK